jgi:hypothetical protein
MDLFSVPCKNIKECRCYKLTIYAGPETKAMDILFAALTVSF